jgi:hypothetical protein
MKPVLQALVLAERIYEDVSGKKIIAGTFNGIATGEIGIPEVRLADGTNKRFIPGGTDPGCPSAYISLTDVVDGTEIDLQYVNASKNEVIFQTRFKLNVASRLQTVEIIAPLPSIAMLSKEEGTFSLDVIWNGEILGSHRLLVKRTGQA